MSAAKSRILAVLVGLCAVIALAAGSSGASGAAAVAPAGKIFIPSGPVSALKAGASPTCQLLCYSPAQFQQAYDWPTGRGAPDGRGETILIVVAFGSPSIESDLASFDQSFGIPGTQLRYCGAPNTGSSDPAENGFWGPETSADVEYAHAMAPGAQIVLVIAPTDDVGDIAATEASCLPQYPGAVVSQSFGEDETDASDPSVAAAYASLHSTFEAATNAGGTIIASSGDFGGAGADCLEGVSDCSTAVAEYPASDPLVTAVGGTEGLPYPGGLLQATQNGGRHYSTNDDVTPAGKFGGGGGSGGGYGPSYGYGGEQVWNEDEQQLIEAATGGAPSVLFKEPSYQRGFNNSQWRTTSDVSYDGAFNGGEAVVYGGQVGVFGGTSIGAPHWAAIVALADEQRSSRDPIGELNPDLYALAGNRSSYRQDFHDITQGDNIVEGTPGFSAGPGYDLPTGLGTPDVSNLISDLSRSSSHRNGYGEGGWQGYGGHFRGHTGRHHMDLG